MIAVLAMATGAFAQQSFAERALQFGIDKAKEAVTAIQKEGKPLAEKMLKSAPEYYKGAKEQVSDFAKRVQNQKLPKEWIDKQKIILELWRLRGAVNVLALSDPSILRSFGIEPKLANSLATTLATTERLLKKAGFTGI